MVTSKSVQNIAACSNSCFTEALVPLWNDSKEIKKTFRESDTHSGVITLSQNCLSSLRNRVYSKRKEFAPHGSKFFPFRVDPFLE